jgi:hypothetical protein
MGDDRQRVGAGRKTDKSLNLTLGDFVATVSVVIVEISPKDGKVS